MAFVRQNFTFYTKYKFENLKLLFPRSENMGPVPWPNYGDTCTETYNGALRIKF